MFCHSQAQSALHHISLVHKIHVYKRRVLRPAYAFDFFMCGLTAEILLKLPYKSKETIYYDTIAMQSLVLQYIPDTFLDAIPSTSAPSSSCYCCEKKHHLEPCLDVTAKDGVKSSRLTSVFSFCLFEVY